MVWRSLLTGAIVLAGVLGGGAVVAQKPPKPVFWRGTLLDGANALIIPGNDSLPVFVHAGDVGPRFEPIAPDNDRIASELKRLCLDTGYDPVRLSMAAKESAFRMVGRRLLIPSLRGKGRSFETDIWASSEARAQIWRAQDTEASSAALRGRQVIHGMGTRALIDTRGYTPKYAGGSACGLTVMIAGMHDPVPLVAALSAMLGGKPVKTHYESGRRFHYAHWVVPAANGTSTRIDYGLFDLNRAEQGLHLSVRPNIPKP